MKRECKTCEWWERGERVASSSGVWAWNSNFAFQGRLRGDCRRNPPVISNEFPRTEFDDWCGSYFQKDPTP